MLTAESHAPTFTVFDGERLVARGSIRDVALAYKRVFETKPQGPVLIFDDQTGRSIDIDVRGSDSDVMARLTPVEAPVGPGRPKLGVVAREVTLLPRHWEWLATQPGGASVVLRKLVEEARKSDSGAATERQRTDRAYYFMSAMAGNLPNFEEASRALFAGDRARMNDLVVEWPKDIREHIFSLAHEN